jgi:hypothetical protein
VGESDSVPQGRQAVVITNAKSTGWCDGDSTCFDRYRVSNQAGERPDVR